MPTAWIIHSFQISPNGAHCRFDLLILDAAVQQLERSDKRVVIEEITPLEGQPPVGTISFKGTRVESLCGDVLIFEEEASGKFWVVDYQDMSTGPACQLSANSKFAGAFVTMFHRSSMQREFGPDSYELIAPGWFTDIYPQSTAEYRSEVQAIRAMRRLDQRLFFAGRIDDYRCGKDNIREVASVLREKYPDLVRIEATKLSREAWFIAAAGHAVCLTLPGGGPWCSREFELFHLGVPVLTYEWVSELQHRWVPNLHYTAVEGMERHRIGFPRDAEEAADRLITRHRQALQHPEVMGTRARQAQDHYYRFFRPERIGREMATFILTSS